ncbi:MAG: two-component system response regulator [Sulfuricellaceae bacterium]
MNDALNGGEKPLVLVVDDTPLNLSSISGLLKDHYRIKVANSGERGLKIANSDTQPDLILLDVIMPEMDGYEVCRQLKANPQTAGIPVVFLTGKTAVADEEKGLQLGAVDYIAKPVSPPILMARVKTHLALKASADFLINQNQFLEKEVAKRTREVLAIQDVTIMALASLAETRDNDTGNHLRRTQYYLKSLAERLKTHPRFCDFLTDGTIEMLFKSAPLHDIGKVGIPDHILLKPGRLTEEEFNVMKSHSRLGYEALENAEHELGMPVPFLRFAKEIACFHHEKWDGSGYPDGLAGDAIPLSARLMALADVYDALISKRVYKDGMSHDRAAGVLLEGRGTHFDPDVVDAFMAAQEDFKAIAARYVG